MFYEEGDLELLSGIGFIGWVIDMVNMVWDIVYVIWNVGWRK